MRSSVGPYQRLRSDASMPLDMLDENGVLRLRRADEYARIPHDGLRLWCHHNARYGLPTAELIGWLKNLIADRPTIEIGSGAGDLCHHLGVQGTDNWQQTFPDVQLIYASMGQPVIKYPSRVAKHDAIAAIDYYKPKIVIGSWITHRFDPKNPDLQGNMYGVDEEALINTGVMYVMIGNKSVHHLKPILRMPHREYALPFIWSRSASRDLERVWIWNYQ